MKLKKTAPPRRRVSFAVDRDEIEINSDWVEAVMAYPPPAASGPSPASDGAAQFPAPLQTLDIAPPTDRLGVPPENNATEEENAAGAGSSPVAMEPTVANNEPLAYSPTVAVSVPV